MALLDSFYGTTPDYLGGLLGETELNRLRGQAQDQSLMTMATALLQAGAPSRTPGGGALAIAQGLQQGQQAYKQALNQGLQEKLQATQLGEVMRKQQEAEAVRKFLPNLMTQGPSTTTPEQLMMRGQPTQGVVRDDEGQMLPGGSVIPAMTTPGPMTINKDALMKLALASPETFAKYKALLPEYKFDSGVAYEVSPFGGVKQVAGQDKNQRLTGEESNIALRLFGTNNAAELANIPGSSQAIERASVSLKRAGANIFNMTDGQKGFTNLMDLKKAFGNEPIYKDLSGMQSAYGQVVAGIDQKTPIGDIAGATKIMKLLDPGSVVRETELGMAMQATGKMDLLQNYFDNWKAGTKLTDKQRVEFKQLANELYNAAAQGYNDKRKEYKTLGEAYKLDADTALGPEAKLMSIMNGSYDPYKKYGLTKRP